MNNGKDREARSPKAKAIIAQALNEGGKVLHFKQESDGTIIVSDETEHLNRLEELVEEHDLEYNE